MQSVVRSKLREALLFRQVDDDFLVCDPHSGPVPLLKRFSAFGFGLADGTGTRAEEAGKAGPALDAELERVSNHAERPLKDCTASRHLRKAPAVVHP